MQLMAISFLINAMLIAGYIVIIDKADFSGKRHLAPNWALFQPKADR